MRRHLKNTEQNEAKRNNSERRRLFGSLKMSTKLFFLLNGWTATTHNKYMEYIVFVCSPHRTRYLPVSSEWENMCRKIRKEIKGHNRRMMRELNAKWNVSQAWIFRRTDVCEKKKRASNNTTNTRAQTTKTPAEAADSSRRTVKKDEGKKSKQERKRQYLLRLNSIFFTVSLLTTADWHPLILNSCV